MGRVFLMVVVSILLLGKFGGNDHRDSRFGKTHPTLVILIAKYINMKILIETYSYKAEFGCIHDIDECVVTPEICNKNGVSATVPAAGKIFAECHNTDGSYDCKCKNGYWLTHD